jgi:galactokinase
VREPIQPGSAPLGSVGEAADQAFVTARTTIEATRWLRAEKPAVAAFAPARLDVMGGIADYSGATVLELPLARGVVAIVQCAADGMLAASTCGPTAPDEQPVALPLEVILDGSPRGAPERLRAALHERDAGWAAYVLGPVAMLVSVGLLQATLVREPGLRIAVWSDVPLGAGISSSAALEVATLRALQSLYAPELDRITGMRLATLAQSAEHQVARAPCGIMDQATSALGMGDHLLMLRCQPGEVLGHRPLPPDVRILGIDSGVAHRVAAGQYGRVRTGAFMGRQIIMRLAAEGRLTEPPGGYLCNLKLTRFQEAYASLLPEEMRGADFIERYSDHGDPATTIEPETFYRVRDYTAHPIYEAANIDEFLTALEAYEAHDDAAALIQAGEAMYRSHASYGARCGLGTTETDLLVTLARESGPVRGIYGARITGGGAGGTVAMLVAGSVGEEAVHQMAAEYALRSGRHGSVLTGSTHGAMHSEPMWFNPGPHQTV